MEKIYSVSIYLIVFLCTLFFTKRAEVFLNNNKRKKFLLCSFLAIVIPCILAGLRGDTVGSDTVRYVWMYENAKNMKVFTTYFTWMKLQGLETGYTCFMFFLSKLAFSSQAMLFIMQLMIIVPVYIIIVMQRKELSMTACMTVFLALFYNVSYNATRQCVALSFILLAYYLLSRKKYFGGIILCIIAISFHNSAFVGIVFILCGLFYTNLKISGLRQLVLIVVFGALSLIPLYFGKVASLLASIGLISDRNSFYNSIFSISSNVEGFTGLGNSGYFSIFIRCIFLLLPLVVLYSNHKTKSKNIMPILLIVIMGTVFYASAAIVFRTIHIYRVTLYAEYFLIIYYPLLYNRSKTEISIRHLSGRNILFYVTLWAYWYLTFIKWNYHQTSNYFML